MISSSSNPISRELDDHWRGAGALWQQWQFEADRDTKMAYGLQDAANGTFTGNLNYRNQRQLQFNKILRIINMVSGYQIDNRLATIITAGDNDPDSGETADQRSEILNWAMNQDQTYEKISECFTGGITCGLNLMSVWMDFREDPVNGTIRTDRLPFSSFIMDPNWTKQDLSDCAWIWTGKYINEEELNSLFPDLKGSIPALNKGYAGRDGRFPFLPQNWYQYNPGMYSYYEYWKRDYKKKRRLLDKATGEIIDWTGTKEQFQIMQRYNPNLKIITVTVPTIKLYVLVNNQVVYEEKSPYGLDRFPFVPFVCYQNKEIQNFSYQYQGLVRNIRDSQVELNRRRNILLDMMDAQVQSGLMVKEDALVNPEDAFFQGPGKILFFKQQSNLATDVSPIPPPPVAQGWMELIATIEKEIMDIVGPEELFAQNMGAKEMSGILMKLKQGAGLTGLRNVFDRVNSSQKILGEIFDDLIVKNFDVGHVERILGKKPTEYFFDNSFSKYNCVVEEGELTSTQRQLKFLQAIQLKQIIPEAISDHYLLENSTLTGKKEIIEESKQKAQMAQQQQQEIHQSQMQQAQILTRSLEAKAQNDFASAEEKITKGVLDIASAKEKQSQAIHERASAALDNSKALKELQHMDDDRLVKLATFIVDMQERQKQLQMNEEAESAQMSQILSQKVEESKMQTEQQQPQEQMAGQMQ
jgi:hypothetical protein